MHIKNLNREQCCYASHTSILLYPGRTVGVCPVCVTVAAWVVMGHIWRFSGAGIYIEAISRENFSEVIRLWWCALITLSAHSFSPNSVYFSCLCLSSSLLYVCLPFICCHSVFVWTPIIPALLSLSHSPPPPHGYVLFGQACVLAYMSWRLLMFTITNWDQHTDVRGPGTETKKGNGFSVMQCWNQRDIHNWWTTFAALLYWPAHEAPGNEPLHITHRANEEEKRARQNREMKRSSDYLNKSFWVETQTILTEAKKIFPFFSFRVHTLSNNKLSVYVTG